MNFSRLLELFQEAPDTSLWTNYDAWRKDVQKNWDPSQIENSEKWEIFGKTYIVAKSYFQTGIGTNLLVYSVYSEEDYEFRSPIFYLRGMPTENNGFQIHLAANVANNLRGLAFHFYTDYLLSKYKIVYSDDLMTQAGMNLWQKLFNHPDMEIYVFDSDHLSRPISPIISLNDMQRYLKTPDFVFDIKKA